MAIDGPGCTRRSVLKGMAMGSAAWIAGESLGAVPAAAAARLPRSAPAAVGVDPAAVLAYIEGANQKVGGLHSFMLLRHGQVAAEGWWSPYAPELPHMLYSLSKSFTSTAVGLAVAEKKLTVDDRVTRFFPDDLPAKVDENLARMQVRHLLSMATGHEKDATGPTTAAPDGNWARAFLALPVPREPGTLFVYNSAATYMLSAIVQKLTGQTVLDYLKPRLFTPLGIENPTWEKDPRGINTGGWGLSIKTEDIARFGQLYLQRGKWDGRQLVPESWVAEATSKHIDNGTNPASDWSQGYGYQFWRCRHGAFRGDGAFGQYCVVMPEQDAVLAITSGVGDMQAVLNVVWETLLPGLTASPSNAAEGELRKRLAGLEVPPPAGSLTSPIAEKVSGKTYRFDANDQKLESATPTFRRNSAGLAFKDDAGERHVELGMDNWMRDRTKAPFNNRTDAPVASRGAWEAEDTFVAKLCFIDTPYVQTLRWKFAGDQVTLTSKLNVAFGPTERPPVTGRAA